VRVACGGESQRGNKAGDERRRSTKRACIFTSHTHIVRPCMCCSTACVIWRLARLAAVRCVRGACAWCVCTTWHDNDNTCECDEAHLSRDGGRAAAARARASPSPSSTNPPSASARRRAGPALLFALCFARRRQRAIPIPIPPPSTKYTSSIAYSRRAAAFLALSMRMYICIDR
jgi:hypothetical protein